MHTLPPSTVVLFSVIAPPTGAGSATAPSEQAMTLLRYLVDHQVACTWALSDLTPSNLAAALTTHKSTQEVALQLSANSAEVGTDAPLVALRRQITISRGVGRRLSTLFIDGHGIPISATTLVKYGITAVCPLQQAEVQRSTGVLSRFSPRGWFASRSMPVARNVRWGLWQMPEMIDALRVGTRAARHMFHRPNCTSTPIHLGVDLNQLTAGGAPARKKLESILRVITVGQQHGALRSQTVTAAAAQLACPRVTISARSILHIAA